jgi:hypothetical protein
MKLFLRQKALPVLFIAASLLGACHRENPKPDPIEPLPVAGGEITPEKRMEVIKSAEGKFASLNWIDVMAAQNELVNFLKTLPQIEAAGIAPDNGNVWARFTDEELLLLVNNRTASPETNPEGGRRNNETNPGARIGVPASTDALLMNSMGNYYVSGKRGMSSLSRIMGGRGYQISGIPATVEKLMEVKKEGVFYFSGHGGRGNLKNGEQAYGLWTLDSASVQNNRAYRQEFKKGNLCYIMAYHNQDRYGKPIPETHLGITGNFVKEHMSFAENALIYIDACGSFTDGAFVDAFLQKTGNTGVYLGWTNNVDDTFSFEASKYFFDRVLGSNDIYTRPETPKQRPFKPSAVLAEMERKGISVYNDPGRPGQVAKLSAKTSLPHNFLRPSISYLKIDEKEGMLYLLGEFGDDPGPGNRAVVINNVTYTKIDNWGYGLIQLKIPASGPGSAGDVTVKIGDIQSNTRRLTEWRGELHYTHPAEGSFQRNVVMDVHLRADVGSFRTAPGETPKPFIDGYKVLTGGNSFAQDCDLFYSLGGTGSSEFMDHGCQYTIVSTWPAAQGTIDWTNPDLGEASLKQRFQTKAELKPEGFACRLEFSVRDLEKYTVKTTQACPTRTNVSSLSFPMYLPPPSPQIRDFTFEFDSNFNLKAGKKETMQSGGIGVRYNSNTVPQFPVTLKWSGMQAQYPPLRDGAARQSFQ